MALESYGSQDLVRATARARQLCEQVGDAAQLLPLLYRQAAYELVRGNFRTSRGLSEEFLRTAESQDADGPALVARRVLALNQWCLGELCESRGEFERMLEIYVQEQHAGLAYQFGQDPRPAGLAVLSIVLQLLGYPDQASSVREEAIARADDIAHANTLGYAQTFAICVLGAVRRDWQIIRDYAPSILKFTEHERLLIWNAWTKFFHSLAIAKADPTEAALARLDQAHNQIHATGTLNNRTFHLALHAEILDASGQTDIALGMIGDALAQVEEYDERWWQAEILRLKGSMILGRGKESDADGEALFQQAIGVARSQGAKSLELRAATSLARFWQNEGRSHDARELLAPIYRWFTEGFDTSDLMEAKTLLDQLGPWDVNL